MYGFSGKTGRPAALSFIFIVCGIFPGHAQNVEIAPVVLPPLSLEVVNVPPVPENMVRRMKQYREIGSSQFLDWAPDNRTLLISSHFEETAQLQYISRPRSKPRQITQSPDPIDQGMFRPRSSDILFARDIEGTEKFDLFLVSSKTIEVTRITDGGGRNISPVFSKDGNWLAWSHADDGSADYRIMLAPVSDFTQQRVVHAGTGYWVPTDFSPDGKSILLRDFRARVDAEIHIYNVDTGMVVQVDEGPVPRGRSVARFSGDGTRVFFLRDDTSEFNNLYSFDIKSGDKINLTADLNHEINAFDISPDGNLVILSCNEGGASQFRLIPANGEKRSLRVPGLKGGVVSDMAFSPNSRRIAFSYSTSLAPENVYTFDVGRGRLNQWTRANLNRLQRSDFVTPRKFYFPTFDKSDDIASDKADDQAGDSQRMLPGYLYRPRGRGPHPVIIYLHGGPAWEFKPKFNSIFQYWVNDLGVAVIAPNVRGSTGAGRTFEQLDNGRKREDSMRDIGALLDWIGTQKGLDKTRIAVYGGSYGGYMSLTAMMKYNDRLAGGVETSGISNLVTFLENTAFWRRDLRRREYGDERDPEMRAWLEARAPVNHPEKFTSPLFIIHGRNDTRVPITEALQMYEGVRREGGAPWLIIADDEGHGFRRKSNSDFADAAVALFFKTILLGEDSS